MLNTPDRKRHTAPGGILPRPKGLSACEAGVSLRHEVECLAMRSSFATACQLSRGEWLRTNVSAVQMVKTTNRICKAPSSACRCIHLSWL